MYNLSALAGAVILVRFPEDEHPNHPGPKRRPSLVAEIDHESRRLLVAYGTSQNVNRNGRGEITIRPCDIPGLNKDTKFCLAKARWIPITEEFLGKEITVIGMIPRYLARDLLERYEEIDRLTF